MRLIMMAKEVSFILISLIAIIGIDKATEFITQFQDATISNANEDPIHGKLKYMTQLQKVANRESLEIEIELEDLREFFDSARDHGFVERIRTNTARYMSLFSETIDKHMPQPSRDFTDDDHSAFDIVMQ